VQAGPLSYPCTYALKFTWFHIAAPLPAAFTPAAVPVRSEQLTAGALAGGFATANAVSEEDARQRCDLSEPSFRFRPPSRASIVPRQAATPAHRVIGAPRPPPGTAPQRPPGYLPGNVHRHARWVLHNPPRRLACRSERRLRWEQSLRRVSCSGQRFKPGQVSSPLGCSRVNRAGLNNPPLPAGQRITTVSLRRCFQARSHQRH
jgi:hypothetical protein